MLNKCFIRLIRAYQYVISPLFASRCCYTPTCSEYCILAFQTLKFNRAISLSFKRILSCHPFSKPGLNVTGLPKHVKTDFIKSLGERPWAL